MLDAPVSAWARAELRPPCLVDHVGGQEDLLLAEGVEARALATSDCNASSGAARSPADTGEVT